MSYDWWQVFPLSSWDLGGVADGLGLVTEVITHWKEN